MKITEAQLRRIIKEEATEAEAKSIIQNEIKPELKKAMELWVEKHKSELEAFYQKNQAAAKEVTAPSVEKNLAKEIETEIKDTGLQEMDRAMDATMAASGIFVGPLVAMQLIPQGLQNSLAEALGNIDPLTGMLAPDYFTANAATFLASVVAGAAIGALIDIARNKLKKNESVRITGRSRHQGSSTHRSENKAKITEAQLRRIVRQEILREGGYPSYNENDPDARDYGIAAWERSQSYAAYDAQLKKAKTQAEVERIANNAAKAMKDAIIQGFDPDDPRFDVHYSGQG